MTSTGPQDTFSAGATALPEAARLLWSRRDWWLLIAGPMLLTLVAWVAALAATFATWDDVARSVTVVTGMGRDPNLARRAVQVVAFGATLVAWCLGAVLLGRLAAGPLLDELSLRVEREARGWTDPLPRTWGRTAGDALRGLSHSALAMLLYVALAGPLALLQLIPGLGTLVFAPMGLIVSALYLSREVFDYPASRRCWSFRSKLRALRATWRSSLGLGLTCLAVIAVPLLNLIAMPLAVTAGTLLFGRLEEAGCYEAR